MTRIAVLIGVFMLALSLGAGAATRAMAGEATGRIAVTGEGTVDAAPDMATIILGVTREAREAGTAMAGVSAAVARILGGLTAGGIEARDIQTTRLNLSPIWSTRNSGSSGTPRITGFAASNTVTIRVRDLALLGQLLDAVIGDGANNFNGLQFSIQEPRPLMDAARRAAVADAMVRAALLAEAAGVTLGPILSISEQGAANPGPLLMEMAATRSSAVPVAPGEVSLRATVSMVFGIAE